jgi:uncharacterized membrane protein YkoI
MRVRLIAGVVLAVAAVARVAGAAGQSNATGPTRLDDGKDLLPQAGITEAQAIAAAQGAAQRDLNEVDLEHRDGKLV